MSGRFFFAYVDPSDDTFIADYLREDEQIFSLDFEHTEANFPSLSLVIRNPRVGLLSLMRKQWAWISWDSTGSGTFADCIPIMFGQIVGIPSDLHGETLTVQFLAKPADYGNQQAGVADTLKVLPFFDPVWIQDNIGDPDTALEAYPALWHVDRLTLEVSVSDIINGEDGSFTIDEADHFYNDMSISFSQVPLTNIQIQGTVSWAQIGSGFVDLTDKLVAAFQAGGSPLPSPYIASMTGDGLLSSWPTPGTGMGGGWTVEVPTSCVNASMAPKAVVVEFQDASQFANPISTTADVQSVVGVATMFNASYPVGQLGINFTASYDANRSKTETITVALVADVQEVFTAQVSSGTDSSDSLQLQSNYVDQAIDPGGEVPIGDPGLPSYFLTDRGQLSFQYLLLVARARLLSRARCCTIVCKTKFSKVALANLSCRKNAILNDSRLPGGSAQGKIVGYTLHADGQGGQYGTVTIACTIGNGGSVSADPGTPEYVGDGQYVETGYQQYDGVVLDVVAGVLTYEDFSDFAVDDDGVDLQNMNPDTVVRSIAVAHGFLAQIAAINAGAIAVPPDPSSFLNDVPTTVTVDLIPVTGGAFLTNFAPVVSVLKVPKTLDLSAS